MRFLPHMMTQNNNFLLLSDYQIISPAFEAQGLGAKSAGTWAAPMEGWVRVLCSAGTQR